MRVLLVVAVLLLSIDAMAAVKILEEGLSTGLTRKGNLNRVEKAYTSDAVYYWIRYEGTDGKKSTMRCVITDPRGVPIDDSSDVFEEEAGGDNWTLCGIDGDEVDLQAGTYKFEVTLNGEKIGERVVPLEARGFFSQLTTRKKYKYIMGALGLALVAYFWIRKRMGHKDADIAVPAGTEKAAAEEVLPIAKAARAAGDAKTAIAAVRGFDKAFPGHSLIPDVFVFSAKVLAEDLKNVAMARKILEHVIAKYPGHHLAQEARNYLKTMPQPA